MRIVALVLASVACGGGDGKDGLKPWIELADLGEPVVTGTSLDLADTEATWLAAESTIPGISSGLPSVNATDWLWDLVTGPAVADQGSCPYEVIEDGANVFRSNCRSQDGYEWTGSVSLDSYQDDAGREWVHGVYDIEVVADIDDRLFDRVSMKGELIDVRGKGGVHDVSQHVQANLSVAIEGWFSTRNDPRREAVWSGLRWSGWTDVFEEDEETLRWRVDVASKVGSYNDISVRGSQLLQGACAEPDGSVDIEASTTTSFTLAGSTTCDSCVEYELDGTATKACEPTG
jgi:hypothetical protein